MADLEHKYDFKKYSGSVISVKMLDKFALAFAENATGGWIKKIYSAFILIALGAYIAARSKLIDQAAEADSQDMEQETEQEMNNQNEVID